MFRLYNNYTYTAFLWFNIIYTYDVFTWSIGFSSLYLWSTQPQQRVFFTSFVFHLVTKRLSWESTHKPHGPHKPHWIKRRKLASFSIIWIQRLLLSDVRMLAWLVCGDGDWVVEGGPVYLKRSFPAALTTTTAWAPLSATQIFKFLFWLRYLLHSYVLNWIHWPFRWILCFSLE